MMCPQSLARATPGFRCGYNDALNGRDVRVRDGQSDFWAYDYTEGYQARLTEARLEREDDRKAAERWERSRVGKGGTL